MHIEAMVAIEDSKHEFSKLFMKREELNLITAATSLPQIHHWH
jgi:hypothetical protein